MGKESIKVNLCVLCKRLQVSILIQGLDLSYELREVVTAKSQLTLDPRFHTGQGSPFLEPLLQALACLGDTIEKC